MCFTFGDSTSTEVAYRAEVASGITGKGDLLEELYTVLRFPDYFGSNWDALYECMCDLSWLPGGCIVLQHRDLPLLSDRSSLATYLDILRSAVHKHQKNQGRTLIVVFPADTKHIVRTLLADA